MKKICVVTGTRAEYGLLQNVMSRINNSSALELQLIVTGMHLSPEFGLTFKEIEKDGFDINKKIDILLSSDSPSGVTKSIGVGILGFADALKSLKPDLMLVLGDRYEIFAASTAAMISRIPIAHLHGGELTEGLIDESIRHSITKMSHLHFVATEKYRKRVIQLGEEPDRVFNVGALGVDNIKNIELLNKEDFEKSLNIKLMDKNLLVTFHPVTLEDNTSEHQTKELLYALNELDDTSLIFTMPNSDTDGRIIFKLIENFVSTHKNAHVYTSLGKLRYLSAIAHVDAVIGNSSSGLIEVPSFKKATINIGDRQRGRIKGKSVIDCSPNKNSIKQAIEYSYSNEFKEIILNSENPYEKGGASRSIVEIIEKSSLKDLIKKKFFDIGIT